MRPGKSVHGHFVKIPDIIEHVLKPQTSKGDRFRLPCSELPKTGQRKVFRQSAIYRRNSELGRGFEPDLLFDAKTGEYFAQEIIGGGITGDLGQT